MSFRQATGVRREQLQAILKDPKASMRERQIAQALLAHFETLSRRDIFGAEGPCAFIALQDLENIANTGGEIANFTYESLLMRRSAIAHDDGIILMSDIQSVIRQISGKLWQTPITEVELRSYLLRAGLSRQEKHIATILLRHFDRISHYELEDALHILSLSDVSRFAVSRDDQSQVVTRQSLLQEIISLKERLYIELWLDRNRLDANGCKSAERVAEPDPLLGFIDRYDRLLTKFPERPWNRLRNMQKIEI